MGSGLCIAPPVWTQCAINNCGIPPLPAAFTTAAGSFISSLLFPSFYHFLISSPLFISFSSLLVIFFPILTFLPFSSFILSPLFLSLPTPFLTYHLLLSYSSFPPFLSSPFSFSLLFYFHVPLAVLSPLFRVFPYLSFTSLIFSFYSFSSHPFSFLFFLS